MYNKKRFSLCKGHFSEKDLPFFRSFRIIFLVNFITYIFSMKNTIKAGLALAFAAQSQLVSATEFDFRSNSAAADTLVGGTSTNLVTTVTGIIQFLVGFLYLIAVIYGIYGGFLILTAAGDEERVKKGKTTLIHAIIGLIVIFLAANIISFIIDILTGTS